MYIEWTGLSLPQASSANQAPVYINFENSNLKMSSDSSEDENMELLKEAVNNEFFSNRLFDPNACEDRVINETIKKPSLRHQEEEKMNDLNVTPEFQNFVATHLMKIIDSQIKEVEIPLKCQNDKESKGGIRLLRSSSNQVSCEEIVETIACHIKRKKIKRRDRFDDCAIPEQERCVEAAVSAEWILSQQAVDGWEPSTKGKVEVYSANEVQLTKTAQQKQDSKRLRRQKLKLKKKTEKFEESVDETIDCDKNLVL